jgi:hypothetical protein
VRSADKDKERVTAMLLRDSHDRKYSPLAVVKMVPSKVTATHEENVALRHTLTRDTYATVLG